ncbi:tetratricopeptide repeat protein [Chryseobacterium oryctis]|uniref:Tetratricopeptide repeat protein n=1 Tax=Chryseobacterium oryctis TaxID=2952618 RepID=A0ABT3HQ86_9FLAO|nr:tetratricopeptide repeat protein [Chryseobacterium oryctis]MCW3161951.1 tetratricopeptide repeat protein [Chryseobacterium oryctis]
MNLLKKKLLLVFFFVYSFTTAQKLTSTDLLTSWAVQGKMQTIEAEKTYEDLKNNINKDIFEKRIQEINNNLKQNPNPRIEVRLVLYEFFGNLYTHNPINNNLKYRLKNSISIAWMLKDEQLLSEIYSLYYEQGFGDPNEKLYYVSKTVEIQERIGAKYFPKLYLRYYNLCFSYYLSQEYQVSIKNGLRGLELLKTPQKQLDIYCFFLDLIGVSYYETGQHTKGLEYYRKLKKAIEEYRSDYTQYENQFSKYNKTFAEIWDGISDGGIASGLLNEKKYTEAQQLLYKNLESSEKYNLPNDISKIMNLLGKIQYQQGNYQQALQLYEKALKNGRKSNDNKNTLTALKGMSDTYRELNNYKNAYQFNIDYYNLKEKMAQEISRMKFISISEKLNQENLKTSIDNAELTIKKQNTTRNISLLVFTIIILLLFIFYTRHSYKQKLRYNISENKRKNTEILLEQSKKEVNEAEEQLNLFRQKLSQNNKIIEVLQKENTDSTPTEFSMLRETTILTNDDWENFKKQFERVYPEFLFELKENMPTLSQAELRYLCLAKLELSPQEIASAIGVSPASLRVTRYRIRKKTEENNTHLINNLLQHPEQNNQ